MRKAMPNNHTRRRLAHASGHAPGTTTRRRWIGGAAAVALALLSLLSPAGRGVWTRPAAEGRPDEVIVYKSPTCACCHAWARHLREAGFDVTERGVADVGAIKRQQGVPSRLASCHTAVVGGYAVEGHVPADVVARLLRERPAVAGVAVPGMPAGSPGMEGGRPQRYEVLTFTRTGESATYAVRG